MADQRIDPTIYGARELDARPELSAANPAVAGYVAPQAVPAVQAVSSTSLIAEGAARLAADNAPKATRLESIGAAMTQWSPVHLFSHLTAPAFDWAEGYSPTRMLGQVDFPLNKEQEKFLLETRSPQEFSHRLDNMREQNMAYRAMGDNSGVAFAAAMLDPGYLAIDLASFGAGRAVKLAGAGTMASRMAAGGLAAAGAYGMGRAEQEVQPLSDKDLFVNAMLNGAATAAFFRNGKVVDADPEFPSRELHDIGMRVQGGPVDMPPTHPDFVGPMPVYRAPDADNLTRPRVAPGGAGDVPLQYGPGVRAVDAPAANVEYNPLLSLSREEQAALNADGRVTQVATVDDIAQHAQSVQLGRTKIAPDAKAVYLPDEDRVFLVQGNIKPGDDVKGILLHEVGVHMNAERVLGTERMARMLDTLEDLALAGNARAKQAFDDVPKDTPLHLIREEALGYYIERNHKVLKDGIVSKFVHAVRETLRRIGLSGLKLTENDIVQLVRKSAKAKAAGSFDATFPYAWHGGPTRGIDQLDTKFMGTGEGAQAFGWGHYISSEKGTALDYRNKESLKRGIDPEEGGLYRVKINARENQFLDLDSRTQSATVQAALNKLGVKAGVTGKSAYEYLARKLGSAKAASEALMAEGVAGNKYATGRTRKADVKSSNYVVFANEFVDMAARYSRATDDDLARKVEQRINEANGDTHNFTDKQGRDIELVFLNLPGGNPEIRAFHNGKEVGSVLPAFEVRHPFADSQIDEGYRRAGLATEMYNFAERISGLRLRKSGNTSPDADAFWAAREASAPRYSKGLAPLTPAKTVAQAVGKGIEWSLHKTMAKFSPVAKKVADLLVDDPLVMSGDSVVSQHRAIRADLQDHQIAFENLLANHMASQGAGLFKRIVNPRAALATQRKVEREVYMEMLRRNRLSMDGMPISHAGVPPHIKEMADALDAVGRASLAELKRSGVFGADQIKEVSGYINRRWDISKIEDIERKLMAGGLTLDAARLSIRDSMSVAIQRANGWDAQLASDVAKAILDRTRSKGYFEDSAFNRGIGDDGLAEVRNILTGSGISGTRMQRVLDVLGGKQDEAGKMSSLKHRVDMTLDETLTMPDGTVHTLADLLDTNVTGITERYLDSVSSQAAFARKGLTKSSDIIKLRSEMLESIGTVAEREQASKLFDNTVASLRGDPVGEDLPDFMRKAQAVTQMVGLARAGLFQFTEYATAMAHFGAGRTMAAAFKELPVIREVLKDSHLQSVLSRNSSADLRIRPYVNRLEDNFEVPVSDAVQMSLMQAKQLVPYLNALKYVQGHQARMVGNLIVNTFERGAKGDVKALAALEQYGLESHIMGQIRADITAHGMDTAKWADSTWDAVRAPLTKMMDDAVLRNRTGEIPAFAQFTSTGKFLFTFRSFVLGAHNKVLAGSLNRSGFGGLGLIMLYQFPLTYLATAAAHSAAGKKEMTEKEALAAAFSQMGTLGLLSEAVGVALQNKQQFGSPGTIAIDRVYKLGSAVAAGDAGAAGAAALNSVPLLSVILPVKAIGEGLKEKD